jgi:hypothetical protein
MLNGGLGRVITSIPALLKYYKNHPNEKWYVMIPAWDFITWGFPELQERTFNPEIKGSFHYFWNADQIIFPEPYVLPQYYRNEISLMEAFDIEINKSTDHSDLPSMQIRLSLSEKRRASEIIQKAKQKYKKSKTIVIQPYGSTAVLHESGIYDESLRSMPSLMVNFFIRELSKDYNLIFMGDTEFHDPRIFKPDSNLNLREWAAIIESADYFIGCDSCGQHMCKALNKKASVMLAGTHKINTSYEDFHIIERDVPFYPISMRISGFESHMALRLNEPRIQFTQKEIEIVCQEIIEKIEGNKKVEVSKPKEIKGVSYN